MKTRLLLLLFFIQGPAFAAQAPDYVRYAEDRSGARLEVAIKTFTLPSGQSIDLIGAVHIADDSYYQELNRRFARYDSVLFELVGDPERLTSTAPLPLDQRVPQQGGSGLGFVQQAAAQYLKLTFQLDAVDYTGKNMVHADASTEQFEKMQAESGETTVSLFARAMQAQMSGQMSTAMNELDTFGLIRILLSEDSAGEFKKSLAKILDQTEDLTAAMEGKNPSVILGGRNELLLKKVREVLARKKQRHIAAIYGAAHMPGIEALLVKELNAKPSGEEWLPAWTMIRTLRADTNPAP